MTGAYGIDAVPADTPGAIICGDCGKAWVEDITPASRCPWEAEHVTYPEHERLAAVAHKSQAVGEFLEWLSQEQGYSICEWAEPRGDMPEGFWPLHRSIESWLAQFFNIDPVKIEQEKRAMLDRIRAADEEASARG